MLFMKSDKKHRVSGKSGFTLVELLVAVVLLLVGVVVVVKVVQNSAGMQVDDYHRRQARAIISNVLETTFDYSRFPGPYVFSGWGQEEAITAPTTQPVVRTVTIDERDNTDINTVPLQGTMAITVVRVTPTPQLTAAGLDNVTTHNVTVNIQWTAVDGSVQVVELTKHLADARDFIP